VNDLRTLQRLAGPLDIPRVGTYHNGMDDALHQIKIAHAAIAAIKEKGIFHE
jgi:hypothetical protein